MIPDIIIDGFTTIYIIIALLWIWSTDRFFKVRRKHGR